MDPKLKTHASLILLFLIIGTTSWCQHEGEIVKEKINSKNLQNTITQENPVRNVSVYLPPSYRGSEESRYPTIYLLHGIGGTDEDWIRSNDSRKYSNIKSIMDEGIKSGKISEMIVVMPDERTNFFGSWYMNSSVTGNWEDFTAMELVEFIDSKYRTIDSPARRGIAGHSMGGYGSIYLSMKHPETFGSTYALSPALIDFVADMNSTNPGYKDAAEARSINEIKESRNLLTMAIVCVAQAFSPNPANQIFRADLPFILNGEKMQPHPTAFQKWNDKNLIGMVSKYRENLMTLQNIMIDAGYEDEFDFIVLNSRKFSEELTNNGIEHHYELYNGDHRNRLWGLNGRFYQNVLPFFNQSLNK